MSEQESSFYSFMQFDSEFARRVRQFYVPFFQGCENVLDIACGRGEFMDVLEQAGIQSQGVDLDKGMVDWARKAGHEVAAADVFDYLREREGAFDGIFSAHLIEHLPYERVAELLELCFRALRPGGRVALCTPNAASLPTLQRQFWWDATHVRMYDVDLLRFMLCEAGFGEVEGGVNPDNDPGSPIDIAALSIPPLAPIDLGRWSRVIPALGLLEQRIEFLNHHLVVVANSLQALAQALYTPSEIYAAGRRPVPV